MGNELNSPAFAGQEFVQVNNQADFTIGDIITISAGTPIEEVKTIKAFGSIILDSALRFTHPATATVTKQAVNPVPPSPVSPCDNMAPSPVSVAPVAPPTDPCASFARLSDGRGTAGKNQSSAFSPVNIGMLGFCALCVAGIA